MRYRKLDQNYDYVFGNNGDDFLIDVEAVAQRCRTRLLLLLGEWWEDESDGLPLFESILNQKNTDEGRLAADTVIREVIVGTPGITQILTYEGDYDTESNGYIVEARVITIYSQTEDLQLALVLGV